MPCKACGSEKLQNMHGELTATFPLSQGSKLDPVYVCGRVVICMDCGVAQMQIPAEKLERVKGGTAGLRP